MVTSPPNFQSGFRPHTGEALQVMSGLLTNFQGQAATIRRLRTAFARAKASNPETNALMASPPTLTAGTTADGTLTKNYAGNKFGINIVPTGGRFYYSGTNLRGTVGNQNVAGDAGNINFVSAPQIPTVPAGENVVGPYYYKFMTDAPKFQIQMAAVVTGNPNRLIVDGQYVDRTGNDYFTNNFLTVDFTSVGGRAPREIWMECQYAMNLFNIKVDPLSRVWKPQTIDAVRAAITGDSHTEGLSGIPNAAWSGCSAIMSRLLGVWDMWVTSVGGTGYLKTGTSGLRKTIRFQMDDWISYNNNIYDLIMFAGGYNDLGFTVDGVGAEALACWRKARAAQPNAFIVVFGVWGSATGPSNSVINMENALQAQFNVWNDPYSVFIPVSTDVTDPWEYGTGFQGSLNGSGNSDNYVFTDGVHDNTAGQQYRGYRMANAIRQAVFSFGS